MADSHLQEPDGRSWTIWECPDCGCTNTHATSCGASPGEPVVHGNRVVVVPASVAEKLATALEKVRPIIGNDELHAEVERLLAEFRRAYPREGTTG
jgi:hypothetical protein